jgi:hypothetical protein
MASKYYWGQSTVHYKSARAFDRQKSHPPTRRGHFPPRQSGQLNRFVMWWSCRIALRYHSLTRPITAAGWYNDPDCTVSVVGSLLHLPLPTSFLHARLSERFQSHSVTGSPQPFPDQHHRRRNLCQIDSLLLASRHSSFH